MSDNELVKDNVVQFPNTTAAEEKAPEQTPPMMDPQDVAKKATNSQEFVIKLIEKNRKKGIEQAQNKLEKLSDRELHSDPRTESALRDVQGALQGLLTWAEAANSLVDFLKHDLISMITNLQQQGAQGWQTAAHLQTLMTTLKEKGMVSEDELKATWEKLIVPGAKAQQADQVTSQE
jgi:hypothetical protein